MAGNYDKLNQRVKDVKPVIKGYTSEISSSLTSMTKTSRLDKQYQSKLDKVLGSLTRDVERRKKRVGYPTGEEKV